MGSCSLTEAEVGGRTHLEAAQLLQLLGAQRLGVQPLNPARQGRHLVAVVKTTGGAAGEDPPLAWPRPLQKGAGLKEAIRGPL